MHDVAVGNEISRSKHLQPISWGKMMEKLFDHIIGRNWNILTDLLMRRINVYNGVPRFIDQNTIKIILQNGKDVVISAETIISGYSNMELLRSFAHTLRKNLFQLWNSIIHSR